MAKFLVRQNVTLSVEDIIIFHHSVKKLFLGQILSSVQQSLQNWHIQLQ